MNKDLVIVESKTVNNESIAITINVAEVRHGEIVDRREISRNFIFEDFQAVIPLKLAKKLVKDYPDEYRIVGAAGGEVSREVESAVKKAKEEADGFNCQFCSAESKSKAGLTAHIRYNHPEEFERLYGKPVKKEPATTQAEVKADATANIAPTEQP